MLKRLNSELLIAVWLAMTIPVMAQEQEMIVTLSDVSTRVFTTWQEVRLVYTLHWLDGFEPQLDLAKLENMSFGSLEPDPTKKKNMEITNQRRHGKENYVDLVYSFRHIGEKKGDIIIPEQVFHYIKLQEGKSRDGQAVLQVKAPGILLDYRSVLTKDADDIMDRIDFGSFQRISFLWKIGAVCGFLLTFSAALLLIFKSPFRLKVGADGSTALGNNAGVIKDQPPLPEDALDSFIVELEKIQLDVAKDVEKFNYSEARSRIFNGLYGLLIIFIPGSLKSDSVAALSSRILNIKDGRQKKLLVGLVKWLKHWESVLYGESKDYNFSYELGYVKKIAENLRQKNIFWFNVATRRRFYKNSLTSLFNRIKSAIRWRKR